MFIKRVIKGKFRSNLDADIVDQVENDDDQQESSNAMIDMKLEQNFRKRRLGTEFSSDAGVVVKPGKVYKSAVQKSIESTLGSQFESRIDDGSGSSAFNHEKIMEQYINQKMGIAEPSSAPVIKQLNNDDDLYRLSDEIKNVSTVDTASSKSSGEKETSSGDQFISLGIAEVALPISFKLSNIEATEDSRRKVEMERNARHNNKNFSARHLDSGQADIQATGTARFWNPSMSTFVQQQEKEKAATAKSTESKGGSDPAQKNTANANNKDGNAPGNTGQANQKRNFSRDDQVMMKFKNNQRNRK